ncbi:hypothetical protein M436DRAFT_71201 [Aureobasidium namibiae CBS 147.97]|uniref:Dienelactone hydrolase n=1 Tax=Aureobasidium namibiae CBS 147.97 TaxID=1043004 RepID=A0A074WNJ4_9PEZI
MSHLVHILSDDKEFDPVFLQHLQEQGFNTIYTPFTGNVNDFNYAVKHLADDLEQGHKYAIIAFGDAAKHTLSVAQQSALPHSSMSLLCHLASIQPFGTASSKTYVYPDTCPGFAESDLEEYDKFAAGLSWGRTLTYLRRGFGMIVDLEDLVDEYNRHKFKAKFDVSISSELPCVNHGPKLPSAGGIDREELDLFYGEVDRCDNLPSLEMRLLSRTVGADRVVDEMMISFGHTQEIAWLLPKVPPTNKSVEVPIVSIVSGRGGRLYQEQLYWDQASVLVQIGLLDPTLVPSDMRTKGLQRLPITGNDTA